jgi:hypothetical protein
MDDTVTLLIERAALPLLDFDPSAGWTSHAFILYTNFFPLTFFCFSESGKTNVSLLTSDGRKMGMSAFYFHWMICTYALWVSRTPYS